MVFPVPVLVRCRGSGNGNEGSVGRSGLEGEPGLRSTRGRRRGSDGGRREPVAGGIVQKASGASEHAQSFVECGVPNATEHAQLTKRHWTAGRFESGGDAFIDGDRDGDGFVRPLEYTERESGAMLLQFECEGRR